MQLSRQQFEALALEQLDLLYRIAMRLCRDRQEAEDLVQETCLRALRSRETFQLQDFGIRPWLLRIMHNLHVSRRQRQQRQPTTVEDHQLETAAVVEDTPAGASDGSSPLDPAVFEGMDDRLVAALNQLAPDYQVVLLLWALEDMSYKEIADAVGIPIGTVMSRLHRARQRLSHQLRAFARETGIIRE